MKNNFPNSQTQKPCSSSILMIPELEFGKLPLRLVIARKNPLPPKPNSKQIPTPSFQHIREVATISSSGGQ